MAIRNHNRPVALYGISDAISAGAPEPIIANRAPQTNDIAALGTAWIFPGSEEIWFLAEVANNVATWTTFFGNVASVTAGVGINITGTAQNPIINLTVPVSIAHGGTNATSMTNTDGVVYFDGTRLVTTAVGTAGDVLTSNGAGVAPTFQAAGGGGITTIDGDTGSATGATVTFNGITDGGATISFAASGATVDFKTSDASHNLLIGLATFVPVGASQNIGVGDSVMGSATGTPSNNIGIGFEALNLITGSQNISIGNGSSLAMLAGANNVLMGNNAGRHVTTGSLNVAIGADVLNDGFLGNGLTTGSNNTIIGSVTQAEGSGSNYTGAESFNIILGGLFGVNGENGVTRIGNADANGNTPQTRCFIEGIAGVTTSVADAVPVLISASTFQLGTVSSSARYKQNIQDMADVSSDIYKLRPTTFTFKTDKSDTQQVGLIAEEVDEIMPNLVVYDKEGRPETIKYQDLPVLLLNEIQKLKSRIDELEAKA